MPLNVKEIEEQVCRLSPHERAQLAERLINSLDEEEDPEAEKLWIQEAERRYREYKEDKIKDLTSKLFDPKTFGEWVQNENGEWSQKK